MGNVGQWKLGSGDRIIRWELNNLDGVIYAGVLILQKAFDVGVRGGIDSDVTTITHPFDRSGSDDVDTFVYQHSGSDSAWHSR